MRLGRQVAVVTLLVFGGTELLPTAQAEPGGTTRVLAGYKKESKGWGNDVGSYLEELWSYITEGHGRRRSRPVWAFVPSDFEGPGSAQTGTGGGGAGSGGQPFTGSDGDRGQTPLPPDPPPPEDYLKSDDVLVTPPADPPPPASAPAPEPGTLAAFCAGAMALALLRKRR